MNLILAMTSLLPYGLHAIWLKMEAIEKQMMPSVNLFTDKFLIFWALGSILMPSIFFGKS
ncbi:hypothetical protein CMK14_27655 [Candidatus Poribacteria bacterium]|nr:hypothetical protein [Candidatus Poribacteria bacterium]